MTQETLEKGTAAPSGADAELDAQETDSCQFVVFVVGNEAFAIDMTPVQEIIRVPEVVRVPMGPPSLHGLANLRGKVLPIISLRRIFGLEERTYDDSTRAVVVDLGQPLGFVVDRVVSVVGVDAASIEDTGSISATVNTELVSGLLKNVGGHAMVMVLDFGKLISTEFAETNPASRIAVGGTQRMDAAAESDIQAASDELQLVSFEVEGQEYAITIADVQEIVQVPSLIVQVPNAQPHVLGLMTLRNRLLPLVSLRRMFGLPPREADEDSRIVVVSLGAASVGVVMDRVNAVLRVARASVDAMPNMLAKDGDMSEIAEICRLDDGKRLVSILTVGSMFQHAVVKAALTSVNSMNHKQEPDGTGSFDEDGSEDEEQVVVFRLGKEEFGVPIESVQEIVRISDNMTHVPKAPPAVEGVINLRGAVLPVIDLRRRLGLEPVARSDGQRIVVLLIAGVRTGFIVDSVAEVLKVHKASIEAAPRLSGERSLLLARMANLEKQKRLVQLIEPVHLIESREREELAQLATA